MIILLLAQTAARADYTSFNGSDVARNIAIIRITDSGVQVQFEVYVGDIAKFEALVPDSWIKEGESTRPPLAERLAEFAETGLSIRRPDGTALPVTANLVEPRMRIDRADPRAGQLDPIVLKVVPSPPKDPRVLYAELFYSFNGDRPDTLVFAPPMDAEGRALVDIGMAVYDHEATVVEFRFLARKATLNIDWQDPWYSRFTDENLWRRGRFPMTSYLYLDPYEVRNEVLIRVRDAVALVGMKPEGPWLTKAEIERLMGLTAAEIGDRTTISVDGEQVSLTYDRGSYLNLGMRGLVILNREAKINIDAAVLGLVWSLPTVILPKNAQLEWTIFNENEPEVPAYSIDAAGPFLTLLTPDEPVMVWTNHFTNYVSQVPEPVVFGRERMVDLPVLSIFLALVTVGASIALFQGKRPRHTVAIIVLSALVVVTGVSTQFAWVTIENPFSGVPDESSIERIASQLAENLHVALQEKIPERLENALLVSISADALEDTKLELEHALIIKMQGGGAGLVQNISDFVVTDVQSASAGNGFQVSADWKATAIGDHWGHTHAKNFRFSALMDIAPIGGAWKLTGITVTAARPES